MRVVKIILWKINWELDWINFELINIYLKKYSSILFWKSISLVGSMIKGHQQRNNECGNLLSLIHHHAIRSFGCNTKWSGRANIRAKLSNKGKNTGKCGFVQPSFGLRHGPGGKELMWLLHPVKLWLETRTGLYGAWQGKDSFWPSLMLRLREEVNRNGREFFYCEKSFFVYFDFFFI